jgi:hypothetical protein
MSVKFRQILALLATLIAATVAIPVLAADEEWQEAEAPPPPAWHKEGLIAIEMPIRTSLNFGVDPTTLTIGPDGVVRYVMVAYSPTGSVNAMYEGLHCDTGEVKTYARSSESGHWNKVAIPVWRELDVTQSATRHALAFARQGACDGNAPGGRTAAELIRRFKDSRKNP